MMKRVTQMYSEMIFNHGFIHCDPHPGNVLIRSGRDGPQVILIDHGLYQTVNDEFRFNYSSLWKALIKGDLKAIRRAAKYLNVEDMFPLLSAMVSGRSWQSVKQGELIPRLAESPLRSHTALSNFLEDILQPTKFKMSPKSNLGL